jgi:hypothetical protein
MVANGNTWLWCHRSGPALGATEGSGVTRNQNVGGAGDESENKPFSFANIAFKIDLCV